MDIQRWGVKIGHRSVHLMVITNSSATRLHEGFVPILYHLYYFAVGVDAFIAVSKRTLLSMAGPRYSFVFSRRQEDLPE